MEETKKCPECGGEMGKGIIRECFWVNDWRFKIPETYSNKDILGGSFVYAYKCSKCGKIELYGKTN